MGKTKNLGPQSDSEMGDFYDVETFSLTTTTPLDQQGKIIKSGEFYCINTIKGKSIRKIKKVDSVFELIYTDYGFCNYNSVLYKITGNHLLKLLK